MPTAPRLAAAPGRRRRCLAVGTGSVAAMAFACGRVCHGTRSVRAEHDHPVAVREPPTRRGGRWRRIHVGWRDKDPSGPPWRRPPGSSFSPGFAERDSGAAVVVSRGGSRHRTAPTTMAVVLRHGHGQQGTPADHQRRSRKVTQVGPGVTELPKRGTVDGGCTRAARTVQTPGPTGLHESVCCVASDDGQRRGTPSTCSATRPNCARRSVEDVAHPTRFCRVRK